MKGRTFLRTVPRVRFRYWSAALLVLLGVAVICGGQQRQRTPRRSRPSQLKVVQLPTPSTSGSVGIEQVLTKQQSLEAPTNLRLTFSEIGQLLWAAQGVMVPQSGAPAIPDAMIPMKVYVVLPDGVYFYSPSTHALQQLREGDLRGALATAILNQQGLPVGGCQIVLAGSSSDFSARFGTRAKNAMWLLAGQMAQSVQLQAISQDLTYLAVNNVDSKGVRRICRLERTLLPLYVIMVGYPVSRAAEEAAAAATPPATPPDGPQLTSKKVLLIAPQREFQDEEFFQTKFALERAAAEIVVASNRSGRMVGTRGGTADADLALVEIKVEDYDALIFLGGAGAVTFASNARIQEVVRKAVDEKKLVAASGTAALILANTNVITNVRVTGLPAHGQLMTLAGGVYTGVAVQRDGSIITSTGPLVVPQFARTVVQALASD